MNGFGILLILVIIALPVAWLVAEFKASRRVRIGFGTCAFAGAIIFTYGLATLGVTLNYNAWYGGNTKSLVETSIAQIEDGHLDLVLKAWRALDAQYRPTYENRGGYQGLVESAVATMKDEGLSASYSIGVAQSVERTAWLGHWENDTGFWIFISGGDGPLVVTRSGEPLGRMQSVELSDDHRVLKFTDGEDWLHTLTFRSKYAATHEWFDLKGNKIWATASLHKLRRGIDVERTRSGTNVSLPTSR